MIKHGMYKSRLYKTWSEMVQRCTNGNDPGYKWYGSNGVLVCMEWKSDFRNFMRWAFENGYNDLLTIDRIDANGNYEPSNCRWITNAEQQRNRKNNHRLTYNGETLTIAEWGERTGILPSTIQHRVSRDGWSVEQALTTAPRKGNRIKQAII